MPINVSVYIIIVCIGWKLAENAIARKLYEKEATIRKINELNSKEKPNEQQHQ